MYKLKKKLLIFGIRSITLKNSYAATSMKKYIIIINLIYAFINNKKKTIQVYCFPNGDALRLLASPHFPLLKILSENSPRRFLSAALRQL